MIRDKNTQVLAAEDNRIIRETLRMSLEKLGYTVVGEAADGIQAVEMTRSLGPDVVLMDIKMPGMDGIEATRQVQETCPTPVVILTAYDEPELIEQASAAGASAYLVKPYGVSEMERAITIAIARFNDIMQLRRLNAGLWSHVKERESLAELHRQTGERLKARVRELDALCAIAEAMNHRSDLDAILQLALDSAIELVGMDSGAILILDPSTDELFLRVHCGFSAKLAQAIHCSQAHEGLMPRLLQSTLILDDLSKLSTKRYEALEAEGIRLLISIPLTVGEITLGVMVIASHSPRTVTPDELELLAAIGHQVGVAVDRANLQAQELRVAVLEERQSMAHQMHDDIAQTLGYLGLQVDNVMDSLSQIQNTQAQAELEEIRRAIEEAYERVRSSIVRLRQDVPRHFDLKAALHEIIAEFEHRTGCRVESTIDDSPTLRLSPLVACQASYIIHEALANVRKHAGADYVRLALSGTENGMIHVLIQDDGQGFNVDSTAQLDHGRFGLRFMRERAERVGGSVSVESQPGQGTQVIIHLPSGSKISSELLKT